jgi:phthiocerol/phenolphthiocerol synthesis type-I polyketide synthase B
MQAELLDARSAHVITGGTGGLGLLFAAWLAGGGARHIELWGRSGRAAADAQLGHLLRGTAQVPASRLGSSRDRVLMTHTCAEV